MKSHNWYHIGCIVLISFLVSSRSYAGGPWDVANIPEEMKEGAEIVTRSSKESLEVVNKAKSIYKHHSVYTVFKENEGWENISFSYNTFFKLSDISLIIYDSTGEEIKSYSKKDFKDYAVFDSGTLQGDSRTLEFAISGVKFPFTVEIAYEKQISSNFLIPDFYIQSFGEAIMDKEIVVQFPKDVQVRMKTYNILQDDIDVKPIALETMEIFRWKFKNKKAIKNETISLPPHMVLPMIKCSPLSFKLGEVEGSMDNWESFSKFLYELNKDRDVASDEIKAVVADLIKDADTDALKIERIYQYVKSNMRYVSVQLGVGGWQSFPAEYVHKNKFGDCKALSNYTKTLLAAAGIESILAVAYRGEKGNVRMDDQFTENVFNHMILYLPKQNMFLECTSRNYPTGYVGSDNDGRMCLLVQPKGGGLKEVTSQGEILDYTKDIIHIDLTAEHITVKYNMTTTGEHHETWRDLADNYTPQEMENYFQGLLDLPPSKMNTLKMSYESGQASSTVTADFELLKFGNITGNRYFVNVNAINRITIYVDKEIKEQKERFYLSNRGTREAEVYVLLPVGYKVENGMLDEKIATDFGEYTVKTELNGQLLSYKRALTLYEGIFPPEKFEEYNKFVKGFNKVENAKVVLIKN